MGTLASELQSFAAELLPAPRVYVDANVPLGSVTLMRQELRWDVLFVLEDARLRRASDRDHFTRAYDLGRTIITLDRDFIDDLRFPPALSPGLIVCSAPDERAIGRILRHVDRTIFRSAVRVVQPLRGRKLELTPDAVV
jgi:predicted nuclease of predicted toxin-antitoxin system